MPPRLAAAKAPAASRPRGPFPGSLIRGIGPHQPPARGAERLENDRVIDPRVWPGGDRASGASTLAIKSRRRPRTASAKSVTTDDASNASFTRTVVTAGKGGGDFCSSASSPSAVPRRDR